MLDSLMLWGLLICIGVVWFRNLRNMWRTCSWENVRSAYRRGDFKNSLVFLGCIVVGAVFSAHSTFPSSAPRREAIGMISAITARKTGRDIHYTISFETDDGHDLRLDAAATPPFFAEGRDKVEVTYLDEKDAQYPRAIAFRALTGPRAGYRTAVSADWFGPWLGVLFSVIVCIATIVDSEKNRRSTA